MHLLWLKSDYIIPPDTGGKIRTFNLLRQLQRMRDVTYVSLKAENRANDDPLIRECADRAITVYRPEEPKSGWRFYARVLRRIPSTLPFIVQKYACQQICDYQQAWEASLPPRAPAVIVCDFLEMALNVNWSTRAPKVLFQHNVESVIWRRYVEHESRAWRRAYFAFEARRMRRYEAEACRRFDLVLTVSEEDRRILREEFHVTRPMQVIETGVDVEYFSPQPHVTPVPGQLVFLGSLDWMPNIDGVRWFVDEVYPRIRAQHPHVCLDLVGRRPTREIQRMASQDSRIRLHPDVPDVRPHLARADLFIVPLRIGGGSRIKIYEAMAMGRPVVSTRVGAEGLDLKPGQHLAVTEQTPESFAQHVQHLLSDASTCRAMAHQGYQFVVENYPWSHIAQKFHRLCQDLAQPPIGTTSPRLA